MSNLHATGIAATAAAKYCRVDHLDRGQHVLFEGLEYCVDETLPVAETIRWAVVAMDAFGRRTVLPYPHRTAVAELVTP